MSPGGVRALRWLAALVPIAALLLVLHAVSPSLRTRYRASRLPDGYENVGRYGPYFVFARPENDAAPWAGEILQHFTDEMLARYGDALGLRPAESRYEVYVFDDHADLAEYSRDELGSDMEYNGGFYLRSLRALGVVGRRSPIELVRPLFHEATHMMLDTWTRGSGHEWSRWFEEGVATYFEESSVEDGRLRLGGYDERAARRVVGAIENGRWIPVSALIGAPGSAYESEDNWLYYRESALLVHWLLEGEGGAQRERFFSYFEEERAPGPVGPSAFARVVGEPDDVDERLRAHALSLE
ncbi:MAG: hypothetical protein ACYS99_12510 [Planctomycetota bacterium]|jgi:hypothetical protein